MKRTLVIALALVTCFAAQAQLPTLRPAEVYTVPNVSRAAYMNDDNDYDNELYWDLYSGDFLGYRVDNIVASSTLSPQGSANYKASNLFDKNHETAWVEGVNGLGVGQTITYQGVRGDYIDEIRILNGYVKSDKAWTENARVKSLKVTCNGQPICILQLQNSRSLQVFDLDYLLYDYDGVFTLKFEILEVYPGTKYQDTAISEIYFE